MIESRWRVRLALRIAPWLEPAYRVQVTHEREELLRRHIAAHEAILERKESDHRSRTSAEPDAIVEAAREMAKEWRGHRRSVNETRPLNAWVMDRCAKTILP